MPAAGSQLLFIISAVSSACLGALHALCSLLQIPVLSASQGITTDYWV